MAATSNTYKLKSNPPTGGYAKRLDTFLPADFVIEAQEGLVRLIAFSIAFGEDSKRERERIPRS